MTPEEFDRVIDGLPRIDTLNDLAARMLGVSTGDLDFKFVDFLERTDAMARRAGGGIVSRQVIASLIQSYVLAGKNAVRVKR